MQTRKNIKETFGNIDVVLLCGGHGNRLREAVSDRPKPMAQINRQPFLDILIDYFSGFGFRRFILCTGHKSEMISEYYAKKNDSNEYIISDEKTPLGTAGALKNAERFIRSNHFIVVNGDSFCKADLCKFYNFHLERNSLMSMAVVESKDTNDSGLVTLNETQRIVGFDEKKHTSRKGYINAGIYLFQKAVFSMIPPAVKSSLEYDVFPKLTKQSSFAFVVCEKLLDIGTPQRYERAKGYFSGETGLLSSSDSRKKAFEQQNESVNTMVTENV